MAGFYSIFNAISLASAIASVLVMFVLGWLRPKLIQRVSLQLQTGIALLDITRHIQLQYVFLTENDILCAFISFYGFFSDHLYIFLNVAIAVNLHLLIFYQVQPKPLLKWIYWAISLGVSITINLVPLSLQYFGKSAYGDCYLKKGIKNEFLIKLVLVHLLSWPGIAYCLFISVLVLFRCYLNSSNENDKTIYSQPRIRQISWNIALYPLTCCITMLGYLNMNLIYDINNQYQSEVLQTISNLGLRSTGLLNLLCLLMDHQVMLAIKSLFNQNKNSRTSPVIELSEPSLDRDVTSIKTKEHNSESNCVESYHSETERLIGFL